MEKRCFLVGQKDSLFKQLVAKLLIDLNEGMELFENRSSNVDGLLGEIREIDPDMILLEEASPFGEDSLLVGILIKLPNLPVIVISEKSNVMHIVRRETRPLHSSGELIEIINFI